MAVIDDGTYAVDASSVAICYKTDTIGIPPIVDVYALTIIPKGVGKPQSPQFRFDDPGPRDDFYKKLVNAMSG